MRRRERLIAEMQQAYGDEEIDEDEIDELVLLHTEPGEAVRIPPFDTPTAGSLARGRDVYLKLGCDKCHGDDGLGAADNPLFDHLGFPTLPRNLVHYCRQLPQRPYRVSTNHQRFQRAAGRQVLASNRAAR